MIIKITVDDGIDIDKALTLSESIIADALIVKANILHASSGNGEKIKINKSKAGNIFIHVAKTSE